MAAAHIMFDGTDYLTCPMPSMSQINGDWTFQIDYFMPSGITGENTIWCLSRSTSDDGNFSSFELIATAGVLVGRIFIALWNNDASNVLLKETPIDLSFDTWYRIILTKSGNTITLEVTNDSGYNYSGSGTWISGVTDLEVSYIGAINHPIWQSGSSDFEDFLDADSKLRNISGSWYTFNVFYENDAGTDECEDGDNIANISNSGPLAGNFTQTATAARPLVNFIKRIKITEIDTKNLIKIKTYVVDFLGR